MRYTFFLYHDESGATEVSEADMERGLRMFGEYIGALKKAGVFVDTDRLAPSPTATTLSIRNGERLIQDGPYAETKEQLGGTFVIDVPDLDALPSGSPPAHHSSQSLAGSGHSGTWASSHSWIHAGIGARAEAPRELPPDVELDVGVAHEERLRVGVDGDELDAPQPQLDHAVDGVDAASADADDLDDGEVVLVRGHVVAFRGQPSPST